VANIGTTTGVIIRIMIDTTTGTTDGHKKFWLQDQNPRWEIGDRRGEGNALGSLGGAYRNAWTPA
jgi:microcystin-dependent protein